MSSSTQLLLLLLVLTTEENSSQQQQHGGRQLMTQAEALQLTIENLKKRKSCTSNPAPDEKSAAIMSALFSNEWSFWFENMSSSSSGGMSKKLSSSRDWLRSLSRLESFGTYGKLMQSWNQLLKEASFPSSRLYLFKNEVTPSWEDRANKNGGKLLLFIPENDSEKALEAFLKIVISIICSELTEQVCGFTLCMNEKITTLAIWTPTVPSEFLRKHLLSILSLYDTIKMFYKAHKISVQRVANRNTQTFDEPSPIKTKTLKAPPGFEGSVPSRSPPPPSSSSFIITESSDNLGTHSLSNIYMPPALRSRLAAQQLQKEKDEKIINNNNNNNNIENNNSISKELEPILKNNQDNDIPLSSSSSSSSSSSFSSVIVEKELLDNNNNTQEVKINLKKKKKNQRKNQKKKIRKIQSSPSRSTIIENNIITSSKIENTCEVIIDNEEVISSSSSSSSSFTLWHDIALSALVVASASAAAIAIATPLMF